MSTSYSIEYSISSYYGEGTYHRFAAVEDGETIGTLYADLDREIIMNIEVTPARQGEGIARALYESADARLSHLLHAPVAACTEAGARFAAAVGGDVAEDMDELADYTEAEYEDLAA